MAIAKTYLEFKDLQENRKPAVGTSLDIRRARLVIGRVGERDAMTLKCEVDAPAVNLADAVAASLQSVTKLRGTVELVAAGSLPNDGKVIDDGREHG